MTNQLYQLIPEPAGTMQEGDKELYSYEDMAYRARPVKAQPDLKLCDSHKAAYNLTPPERCLICAIVDEPVPVKVQSGRLWRDLGGGGRTGTSQGGLQPKNKAGATAAHLWRDLEPDETVQNGDRYFNSDDGEFELFFGEMQWKASDKRWTSPGSWQRPVPAQPCACEGLRRALEEVADHDVGPHLGQSVCWIGEGTMLRVKQALAQSCQHSVSHSVSHSVQQPEPAAEMAALAEELTKPEPRVAAEEKALDALVAMALHPNSDEIQAKVAAKLAEPPAAASEPQVWDEHGQAVTPPAAASEAQATPRTDLAAFDCVWIRVDFARRLERELNQANATVAALRLELEEAKKAKHRAGQLWPKLIQAEDDRDQWKDLAKTAQDESLRIRKECDQWKGRVKVQARSIQEISDAIGGPVKHPWISDIISRIKSLHAAHQPEIWHDYATDPPKEKDGVTLDREPGHVWWLWDNGTIDADYWDCQPRGEVKWARITWPPVPAEPVQDKDEEAAQYAADHIFQPLMGEVTISDSQHRVIRNYAITVAKAALSHARATEEK